MVSIIKVTSVQDTSGNNETTTANIKKAYDGTAKAWVSFIGTGTASIHESLNCGSLTDNGTGSYNISITSAMAYTNYALTEGCRANESYTNRNGANTSSVMAIGHANASGTAQDVAWASMTATGDLA